MKLLDSRRLTGANCISDCAGAVIDIEVSDDAVDSVVASWTSNVRQLLEAVGWQQEETFVRRCTGGVSLTISAPIDALYAATDVNECAWETTLQQLTGTQPPQESVGNAGDSHIERLKELIKEESRPSLLQLQAAAQRHDVVFLFDDEQVSVGMGTGSKVWPVSDIPAEPQIDWDTVHDIPVGLITGTNGKTTSVRMAASVASAAGMTTGYTSTDSITIGDQIVDYGDFAGPEGARSILRDSRVDMAVLETARGGLLRRGVNVPRARAALLTRIASDHIGDFGSRNLQELLDIKWVVTRALNEHGRLILNADDQLLVQQAPLSPAPVVYFSLDSTNPVIARHIAAGGAAWALHKQHLARWECSGWRLLMDVKQIPLTVGGAARHNVANALGVAALCFALGLDESAIVKGLSALTADANPGRGNLFDIRGVKVLVDFAHNPDAFRAIVEMSQAISARRRLIAFGEAGDRTDDLIRDLATSAWQLAPDRVMTLEIAKYARGRERGEIAGLLHDQFKRLGASAGQISHHETELGALQDALNWAQPGDMIILFSLAEQDAVLSYLSNQQ